MYQKPYKIHFIGIGGIGMSGIAELLISLGYAVSGSDIQSSPIIKRLKDQGAKVYIKHKKEQVKGVNVVVTSTAIPENNPEVIQAKEDLIPIIPRAEMLAELMRLKYSIAISGAHGKTSTTSMVAEILNTAKLDPTVIIGGLLKKFDTNALHGKGEFIVAEADESDGSFLKYSPALAIVTNIDLEHLDYYKGIDDIKNKFVQFINSVPFYGLAILCLDNEHIQDILPKIDVRYTTFGMTAQADLQAKNIHFKDNKSFFTVLHNKKNLGEISLNLAGEHNVSNALASIATGLELNIDFKIIKKALEKIEGVKRRLEIKGEKNGVIVIDDYGHHPTEIRATLDAVRQSYSEKRIIVLFQPHRYTRTKELFDEFKRSFYRADLLFLLPIYAASEKEIKGVTSKKLMQGIKAHGHKNVVNVDDFNEVVTILSKTIKKNDLILTLGAGDVYKLGETLLEKM